MHKATLVLVVLASVTCVQSASWTDALLPLLGNVLALFENGPVPFMGVTCHYKQVMKIIKWELHYRGTFTCPTVTNIEGSSLSVNPSKVKVRAITDFLEKAVAAGVLSQAQVNKYLGVVVEPETPAIEWQ